MTSLGTLGELIDRLQALADAHGRETWVGIEDADTGYTLDLEDVIYGVEGAYSGTEGEATIRTVGYHGDTRTREPKP